MLPVRKVIGVRGGVAQRGKVKHHVQPRCVERHISLHRLAQVVVEGLSGRSRRHEVPLVRRGARGVIAIGTLEQQVGTAPGVYASTMAPRLADAPLRHVADLHHVAQPGFLAHLLEQLFGSARMVACHRRKVGEPQTSHRSVRSGGSTPQPFAEVFRASPTRIVPQVLYDSALGRLELLRRLGGDLRVLRKDPRSCRSGPKENAGRQSREGGARLHEPLRAMASARRCSGANLGLRTRWQLVRSRSTARINADRQWVTAGAAPTLKSRMSSQTA